jgi:hypothetical protein
VNAPDWPPLIEFHELDVRTDIDQDPWTDLQDVGVGHGHIERVGFLRNGTKAGRGSIALVVRLDDGRLIIAETTYRLAYTAARVIAASPAAAEEDLS